MTKDFVDQCDTYSLCSRRLAHAADAGAAEDLKTFGADLATRARRASAAGDKTVLYGAASEAFRLAQEKPAAIAVAREGLRFIPAAKNTTATGRIEVALQGEFAGDDDAVAPAIALYRAGARDEAVASGYLTGYARYRHAARGRRGCGSGLGDRARGEVVAPVAHRRPDTGAWADAGSAPL